MSLRGKRWGDAFEDNLHEREQERMEKLRRERRAEERRVSLRVKDVTDAITSEKFARDEKGLKLLYDNAIRSGRQDLALMAAQKINALRKAQREEECLDVDASF